MAHKDEVTGGGGTCFLQFLLPRFNHVVVDVVVEVTIVGEVVVVIGSGEVWFVF